MEDYFAAKAMQGLLSNPEIIDNGKPEGLAWIAEHAYKMADAMMVARSERRTESEINGVSVSRLTRNLTDKEKYILAGKPIPEDFGVKGDSIKTALSYGDALLDWFKVTNEISQKNRAG